MAQKYTYDIKQFRWEKSFNTFYADAWDLVAYLPDNTFHPAAFPNMKQQFYIKNYKTGNERRFRFVKEFEIESNYDDESTFKETIWQFESEDGIFCNVCVEME